jgi:hypothetical protein
MQPDMNNVGTIIKPTNPAAAQVVALRGRAGPSCQPFGLPMPPFPYQPPS